MTEGMVLAYVEAIPHLRAQRILDWAEAASAPHLGKYGPKWWRSMEQRARAPQGGDSSPVPMHRRSAVFFERRDSDSRFSEPLMALHPRLLRQKLGGEFGQAVSS